MTNTDVSALTDRDLEVELVRLAGAERSATVALLIHLGEFDARRLYEPAGFPSLFAYCLEVLRLSRDATYNRIEASRAARRFPAILDRLSCGALTLTTARLLARRLTEENADELLAAAAGKTREDVEELLARRCPSPDVASSVRKLPATPPGVVALHSDPRAAATLVGVPPVMPSGTATAAARPVTVRPLAPERYEVRFTAGAETRALLRRAQDLLADAVPSADLDEVFRRSLKVLVENLERRKFAASDAPRGSRGQADDSRHVPAVVKRFAWTRDGGRCAFVSRNGRRCDARRHLQFHHVAPYAAGGKPTVENIQLRCRAHNNYEARVFYGPMREYAGGGAARPGTSPVAAPFRVAAPGGKPG